MAVNPMMEQARVNGMNSAIKGLNQAAQDVAELNVDRVGGEATHACAPKVAEQADALLDLQLYERQVQAKKLSEMKSEKIRESSSVDAGTRAGRHPEDLRGRVATRVRRRTGDGRRRPGRHTGQSGLTQPATGARSAVSIVERRRE